MILPTVAHPATLAGVAMLWCLAAGSAIVSRSQEPLSSTDIAFIDRSQQSGLDYIHHDGQSGEQYLYELMSAGLASLDYDNDGLIDAFLPHGYSPEDPENVRDQLYRNVGRSRFTRVTLHAGLPTSDFGLGVTAGDYNNDGFQDLYVSSFGENVLLHNNGDGTFSDASAVARVTGGKLFSAGVAFLDANEDGNLDLFVGNYVDFSRERHHSMAPRAYPYPPGPKDYSPIPDQLFLNLGDGRFLNASQSSGIGQTAGPTMGVVCGDFDLDGDSDVFTCCDGAPNHLFRNQGNARFEEVGVLSGVAYDLLGNANGSMGADAWDLNEDLLSDIFVTDYTSQLPMLFLSYGPSGFEDATRLTAVGRSVRRHVNWGGALADFDLDADSDVLIANGHFLRNASELEGGTAFRVRNTVMENVGNRRFVDVSPRGGDALLAEESSRGVACDDLDNDGDVDAIVLNCGAAVQVLENVQQTAHHWVAVRLVGRSGNRDGVGARVVIRTADSIQSAEVRSGRGYQSHYGTRLCFGLGDTTDIESITIHWPHRPPQVLPHPACDRILVVLED